MSFTLLILVLSIQSQNLEGYISHRISKHPLAYTNLVIKGKNIGAYSDELGRYNLSISNTTSTDTLVLSLIGYLSQHISLADFIGSKNSNYNFELSPKI